MEKIIIALDAMGGDNAPVETVKGGVMAANETGAKVILVGREEVIKEELKKYEYDSENIEIANATEVIGTDESPTSGIKKKKDSSVLVGLKLVKEGKANAFVSAGSTGALLVGGIMVLGKIEGVSRPVLGTGIPTVTGGYSFMLDCGANVDCKPSYLVQFAEMGAIYVESVMGIENPRVGLINNGAEKEKGNSLTKQTYELLEESGLNFVGNVEAVDIPFGKADVIVCDGFVGNMILKLCEGLPKALMSIIKEELVKTGDKNLIAGMAAPFGAVKSLFDAEEIGGAAFLGLNALLLKVHGGSQAGAIKNAVKQCVVFTQNDTLGKFSEKVK